MPAIPTQSLSDMKSADISLECPYRKLLTLAADAGRDSMVIEEILQCLDAHPLLIDLPRVLQGLVNTLAVMDIPPVLTIGVCDPKQWIEECKWIISNRSNPAFIYKLGALFYCGDERRQRNPILGKGVQDHAFPYATLWHEPADVESEQDYYRLLGQLFSICLQSSNGQGLWGQRYSAYLELRALCARQELTIPVDLNLWANSAMFVQGCRLFDVSSSVDYLAEYFPPIARLARYYGGEEPPERHGGGSHSQSRRAVAKDAGYGVLVSQGEAEFPLEDPDDPDLLAGFISFASQPIDNDLDEALPPGELTAQSEMCLLDTGNEFRPFVADLLSHQGMLAHIARARQFLPFGYNLLTLSELANLLFGVTDEFVQCRERLRIAPQHEQRSIRRRLEALLALHLMLWFGRSLADCKKLKISERDARPAAVLELIPADETGSAEFRFFAPRPEYSAEEVMPRESVRASQKTISVPDLVGACAFVMSLYEASPEAAGTVFRCQIKELEREMRALLDELGGGDPRYTILKIRSYLQRQIIADSHDIVGATLLSGVPCLSANTALYYSQLDVNYLRGLYCSSVRQVITKVYACVGLEASIAEVPVIASAAVGARNCLKLDAVKANLKAMLEVLRKRPRTGLQELVRWHNCYTLWVVQMFMIATGCRAIRNPLKSASEFDSRSWHGALGDKGTDDGHMSRLVALPDIVRRQLHAYEAHCDAIRAYLCGQQEPKFGFFLRLAAAEDLRYEEIRPLHIREVMREIEGFITHPVNGFRKLVRTELTERGCPPEVLAAYMGHWLHGEEPQDIFSSFCPRMYIQNLHDYLLPLMRELGWTVRNSHLVLEVEQ